MNLLGEYQNGNYKVQIYNDGTKIRLTDEEDFIPAFAESIDCKITNHCENANCPICHEGSIPNGKHGDILNEKFFDTLHPYTELAIGGGNPLSHPDLISFLQKLKEKNVIANLTVNQIHFESEQKLVRYLVDEKLIYGLGVSLVKANDNFIELIKQYPNAVIHVINGMFTMQDWLALENHGLKLLILGYKKLRRGKDYWDKENFMITTHQKWLKSIIKILPKSFDVVSFDNLALKQLEIKDILSQKQWDEFYMGDDAQYTFYIDTVEHKFARSSTVPLDERYDLLDSVDNMFNAIRR